MKIDDYVIDPANADNPVVRYGKFSATLSELEESGVLTSKSGRTHIVPAWAIAKIASSVKSSAQ